jgi:hypothetical protein
MYDVNRATWNLRLGLIGLTAVSVSLPMAWISLAKVLIFVCALLVLVNQIRARRSDSALGRMWTPWAIATAAGLFGWQRAVDRSGPAGRSCHFREALQASGDRVADQPDSHRD